jgi:hypothetical protein
MMRELIQEDSMKNLYIGIDACRAPLTKPRAFYWNGTKRIWRKRASADKGLGRHCEVVIKAHNLANPQWTPMIKDAPEWMKLGFELFKVFDTIGTTYEAFPSASYALIQDDPTVQLTVNFSNVRKGGAKDVLDAWMNAATTREFVQGHGMAVGGGDGLGSIILPRPLPNPILQVLNWPVMS